MKVLQDIPHCGTVEEVNDEREIPVLPLPKFRAEATLLSPLTFI
jgi:hypothetical protein